MAPDVDSAIQAAAGDEELFVIGGEVVFAEALPVADRIYLTLVHAILKGDAYFPSLDETRWRLVEQEHQAANAENEYDLTFRNPGKVDARTP